MKVFFRLMVYFLMILFCVTFWFGVYKCFSEEVDIVSIISLESSGEAGAFNPQSKAFGLMQITLPCLRDWNQAHILDTYGLEDLFDPEVNVKIGTWYINEKIPM